LLSRPDCQLTSKKSFIEILDTLCGSAFTLTKEADEESFNTNSPWPDLLMITVYNLSDTTGKYSSKFREYYSIKYVAIVLVSRFIFFATFILQVTNPGMPLIGNSSFCFGNIALFGFTNGFCTGTLYILGPELVSGHKKELVGYFIVLSLRIGIMVGSFLALFFVHL
jgi:solute carrier family 29 (equilibrative nucleoside transporter), member 1/2/3